MYEYALWHDVRGVNVWMHVRTCSAHEVGRCFWHQCAHGFEVRIHMDTWSPESPETCRILRSRISQDSRLFRKSRDFCEILDFQDLAGFRDFGRISGFRHFGARIAVLAPEVRNPVRTGFRTWGPDRQVQVGPADLDLRSGNRVRTRNPDLPGVLIDHFQLPPWWKMTGQEGDPFGGPRWHWPSKRRDFEKNLLITKSLKIAEKGTFFSFTLRKVEKLTIFLPSRSEICRHLRRVVPTAYRPKFRKFWGPRKSKFSHFFWTSGGPKISCPDTNLRKSALSRKVEILAILVSGTRFRDLTYGSLLGPKISRFPDFSGFLRFLRFLRFFRISQDFRISGLFRTCRESTIFGTSELDFWGPKNSRFRTFRTQVSDMESSVDRGHVCGIICTYFSVFFVCKKNGKIYLFGLNHLVTAG